MSSDEIIKKAGIDPRKEPSTNGIRYNWAHEILNQVNFLQDLLHCNLIEIILSELSFS